jgi:flagellar protein FlaI
MGIFAFNKKEEKPNTKALDEIRRLTTGETQKTSTNPALGQENLSQQAQPPSTNTKPEQENPPAQAQPQKEIQNALEEEQRIFTQVSSIKELTPGEQNYEVPKELKAPEEPKTMQGEVFAKRPKWKARGEILPNQQTENQKTINPQTPNLETQKTEKENQKPLTQQTTSQEIQEIKKENQKEQAQTPQNPNGTTDTSTTQARTQPETQSKDSDKSAFEKLMQMAKTEIKEDTKKETMAAKAPQGTAVFSEEKKEIALEGNAVKLETKSEEKPIVIQTKAPEVQTTQTTAQKTQTNEEAFIEKITPKEKKGKWGMKSADTNASAAESTNPTTAMNKTTSIATKPQETIKPTHKWGAVTPSTEETKTTNTGEVVTTPHKWAKQEKIVAMQETPQKKEPKKIAFFAEHKEMLQQQRQNIEQAKLSRTPVDEMFTLLEKYNKIDAGELANYLKTDSETIEKLARVFEGDGTIEIEYPTSLTKKPILTLKNPPKSKLAEIPTGKILETYKIELDYVPAQISIILVPNEARPIYAIEMPAIGVYTRKFLDFIKDEVAETMPIELEEILDPKKSKKLKERFFAELTVHLATYFPKVQKSQLYTLSGVLLHEMYGLGDIELLMGDDMLEEVSINSSKTPITIYHRVHGWLKTNLMPGTEEEINNFASQIGRKIGREITTLNPILDAHLLSGDRVNATLFPISTEGNTITIRRFARKPWTLVDFIGKAHTMNAEMAATLWLAMQYEMNILIAGGTASGKTSTLNTLLALVPTYHRIISIEDVREIVLPKYLEWNWVPMITRSPNPEGMGEVAMLDLMVTSLRMRPDRIIVGEIRRKKEAEVLMEAIETGHSIYSTIHANSGYQVLRRLAEAPISIPLMQIELIDLIVVQYRDRKTNKRRTFEISEIEQTSTGQGLQINTIYKWSPRTDNWEKLNKPTKLITLLNLHTGMTEDDITNEINDRVEVLEWMKRNNVIELNKIGYLVKLFYSDPGKVKRMAKQNTPLEEIDKIVKEDEGDKDMATTDL